MGFFGNIGHALKGGLNVGPSMGSAMMGKIGHQVNKVGGAMGLPKPPGLPSMGGGMPRPPGMPSLPGMNRRPQMEQPMSPPMGGIDVGPSPNMVPPPMMPPSPMSPPMNQPMPQQVVPPDSAMMGNGPAGNTGISGGMGNIMDRYRRMQMGGY